jgi:hypothetical protein
VIDETWLFFKKRATQSFVAAAAAAAAASANAACLGDGLKSLLLHPDRAVLDCSNLNKCKRYTFFDGAFCVFRGRYSGAPAAV